LRESGCYTLICMNFRRISLSARQDPLELRRLSGTAFAGQRGRSGGAQDETDALVRSGQTDAIVSV
jgi:hypothetical protein